MEKQLNKKVYISCPISVPLSELTRTASRLYDGNRNTKVNYWQRGTPYEGEGQILHCDYFVIMLPNNAFTSSLKDLPIGVKRELNLAKSLKKKIFLAYKTSTDSIQFYETIIKDDDPVNHGYINAISGTYNVLHTLLLLIDCHKSEHKDSYVTSTNFTFSTTVIDYSDRSFKMCSFDERLVLFL